MARKAVQKKENNDGKELFEALRLLEAEKGIPIDFMIDKIKKAIVTACKNSYGNEDVVIDMDPDKGQFDVFLRKQIVEEVEDPNCEIARDIAAQYDPRAEVGGFVRHRLDTKQFGRVAAQTARNIIRQGIRDSERGQMMQEFRSRHQELVSALVERVDPKTGALSLKIGKAEAVLPKSEQVGTENVREGDYVQVYVVDVKETEKGPKAIISRTHPDLIRRLFEKEVPEIFDGTVEIKAVAREAGSRTKIAVVSHNPDVDAVGACIGTRGARVTDIVNELGGEKMGHRRLQRRAGEVHRLRARAGHGPLRRARGGRLAHLQGHRAGQPALARNRQQGPERPPRREADRLEDRHQARKRLLRRRRSLSRAPHRAERNVMQKVKPKKIPLRMCAGCGEMKPKKELVRVVRAPVREVGRRGDRRRGLAGPDRQKAGARRLRVPQPRVPEKGAEGPAL